MHDFLQRCRADHEPYQLVLGCGCGQDEGQQEGLGQGDVRIRVRSTLLQI